MNGFITWNEFIEDHYKKNIVRLRKSLFRSCGDSAEDVIHNAYENCIRYKSSFMEGGDFEKWFGTILRNCIKTHKREERGREEPQIPQEFDEFDYIGAKCNGFYDKIWKETVAMIDKARPDHAEILSMYFYLGYSYKDIAAVTSFTYFNTYKIIDKFKKLLIHKYKD